MNFQRKLRIEISLWHQIWWWWFAVIHLQNVLNKIINKTFFFVFNIIFGCDCVPSNFWAVSICTRMNSHELIIYTYLSQCWCVCVHLISNAENKILFFPYCILFVSRSRHFKWITIQFNHKAHKYALFRTFGNWLAISLDTLTQTHSIARRSVSSILHTHTHVQLKCTIEHCVLS